MTASGVKDMVEAADSRAEPQSVGENGAPMTIWQVWLRRLCLFVIVWAIAEVLLGAALWGAYLFARMVLDVEPSVLAEPVVGAMAMAGACLNLAIGFLGLRGARNPRKITLFFWITFVDAMLRVIGKKVCPEPNRNPCDKGRLHAGHSIAQQCPSAPPLHLFR